MRQDITSKIRSRVDRFRISCDEYDEQMGCFVAWLPRPTFDRLLPGPLDTLWALVLDAGDRLSVLVSERYDRDRQELVSFGSLPFGVQKMLVRWMRANDITEGVDL